MGCKASLLIPGKIRVPYYAGSSIHRWLEKNTLFGSQQNLLFFTHFTHGLFSKTPGNFRVFYLS